MLYVVYLGVKAVMQRHVDTSLRDIMGSLNNAEHPAQVLLLN